MLILAAILQVNVLNSMDKTMNTLNVQFASNILLEKSMNFSAITHLLTK